MHALASVLATISLACCLAACTDRPVGTDTGADTEDPMRPAAGEMYSKCFAHQDCAPLPYCVFPEGEPGFCTHECTAGAGGCPAPGSGDAAVDCVDVGSSAPVCALDCEDAACPYDMVCRLVMAPEGERTLCF